MEVKVSAVPVSVQEGANIIIGQSHFIKTAEDVGAGHSFFLVLQDAYPINVLNQLKSCQEVCRIFCATANPVQVLVGSSDQGRGIMGVIDGFPPKGVEKEKDKTERRSMLRRFGYKF